MSWSTVKFETLYAEPSRNGLNRSARVRGAGYKMINMGELFANDRIGDIPMDRVPMNEREFVKMLVKPGDLLFARQSLVLSGAGKCCIVQTTTEPTTFESHIIRVRLKHDVANPRFYYYYFRSPRCGIRSIVTQGVQAGIRGNDLKQLLVHTPTVEEQTKIASTLSAYDDLIENNRRRIQLLEQSARLLYKEWFVHLRFPGHKHTPITNGIPAGWREDTVGNIASRIKKNYTVNDEDLPLVDLARIRSKTLAVTETGHSSDLETSRIIFEENDILFSSIRPYLHKVTLAPFKGITNTSVFVVRPNGADSCAYAAILLSDNFTVAYANQHTTGTKMPVVKWASVASMPIVIPPQALLRKYQAVAGPMLQQVKSLYFVNRRLAQARDLLLPRLMSGEAVPELRRLEIDR